MCLHKTYFLVDYKLWGNVIRWVNRSFNFKWDAHSQVYSAIKRTQTGFLFWDLKETF